MPGEAERQLLLGWKDPILVRGPPRPLGSGISASGLADRVGRFRMFGVQAWALDRADCPDLRSDRTRAGSVLSMDRRVATQTGVDRVSARLAMAQRRPVVLLVAGCLVFTATRAPLRPPRLQPIAASLAG